MMPDYTLELGGVERNVIQQSIDLRLLASGLSTLAFDVDGETFADEPLIDESVVLLEDVTPIFRGYLTDSEVTAFGDNVAIDDVVWRCSAVELKGALSFAVVSGTFAAGSLESQLTELVTFLTDYGITLHPSQITGPSMPEVIFDGARADRVLEQLIVTASDIAGTGYLGEVTPDNLYLNVYDATARAAAYNLAPSGAARQVGDVKVQRTRDDKYGTTVILTVNGRGSATSSESFVAGDGVVGGGFTTFTAKYPSTQSVNDIWPGLLYFDGVSQGPIGFGVENLVQNGGLFGWAWDHASSPAKLVYDSTSPGVVFPTTETITVTYAIRYPYPVTATVAGSPAPALPRTIQMSTDQPLPYEAAVALAQALVSRSAVDVVRAQFESDDVGWRAGTTLTINEPKRGINGTFVIDEVGMQIAPGADWMRHRVTAVLGSAALGNWRSTPLSWLGGNAVAPSVTGSAGPVVVTGGSVAGGSYTLSTSVAEWVQDSTWTPASGVQIIIDTAVRGSTSAVVTVRLRARSSGISVTPRLRNVSDGTTAGTGSIVTTTTFSTQTFAVTLASGTKAYELQLLPSAANEDVQAIGYLE